MSTVNRGIAKRKLRPNSRAIGDSFLPVPDRRATSRGVRQWEAVADS